MKKFIFKELLEEFQEEFKKGQDAYDIDALFLTENELAQKYEKISKEQLNRDKKEMSLIFWERLNDYINN